MGFDFTGHTEYSGNYFDFGTPFEFSDGRVYRPRCFSVRPLGSCVRCEAEVAAESDGDTYFFVVRFWDSGAARYLVEAQQRAFAIRVRQIIYAYLQENQRPPAWSRAGDPIEFDRHATPPPLFIP